MGEQLWTGLTGYYLDRKGQVDTSEKIGTFLYTLPRIVAGREYKVVKNKFKEQDPPYLITRVITLVVSVLLSPILLCTTLVGYGLLKYSTSYQACLTKHQKVVDHIADKALKNNQPEVVNQEVINQKVEKKEEEKPLSLEEVEKIAKESDYKTSEVLGLKNLTIFEQAQEANLETVPAVMKGAIASKKGNNIIAVIFAILKQVQADGQKIYLDKLQAVMKVLTEEQLSEAIIDQEKVKDELPGVQIQYLKEQQLDFILKYKDQLELSPAIVTKMEEVLACIEQLKEQTKDELTIIFD